MSTAPERRGDEPPEDGCYRVALAVRWRDLDALGHVNYATYLTYLEEGRDAWLSRELGLARGTEYVVAAVSIRYRSEITLKDDPVSVEIVVASIGTSSLTTTERIFTPDGRLAAEGEVTIVFWDAHRRRARPIADHERAKLTAARVTGRSAEAR